mgnify:CR=1 FL=1
MPNKLFLRPLAPIDASEPRFEWGIYDNSGVKVRSGDNIELAEIEQTLMQNGIEHLDLFLLWPSNAAYTTTVNIPGNQTRYIQQALPFAVEEQFAVDVESLHLCLGDKNKDGGYKVVGIDHALFGAMLDACQQFETFPLKSVYLDSDVLIRDDYTALIFLGGDNVLVQHKNGQSISLGRENLIAYMDTLFLGATEESESPDQDITLKIYIEESEQDAAQLLLAEIQQYPAVQLNVEPVAITEFELLCESFIQKLKLPTNLCQGDFRLATSSSGSWMKWRSVAAILALGLFVQLGVFVGKGIYYNQQAEHVGVVILDEYKKIVPGSKNVSLAKLPRIIKGKLNQKNQAGASDLDFMTLLGEAGFQYKKAADKTGFSFNSINYNDQRGELVMEMRASNFDQLDRLKQDIVAAGLTAKISSAVQEKGYFRGRISVGG